MNTKYYTSETEAVEALTGDGFKTVFRDKKVRLMSNLYGSLMVITHDAPLGIPVRHDDGTWYERMEEWRDDLDMVR